MTLLCTRTRAMKVQNLYWLKTTQIQIRCYLITLFALSSTLLKSPSNSQCILRYLTPTNPTTLHGHKWLSFFLPIVSIDYRSLWTPICLSLGWNRFDIVAALCQGPSWSNLPWCCLNHWGCTFENGYSIGRESSFGVDSFDN